MRENTFAIALTFLIASLVAAFLWWDARQQAADLPSNPAASASNPARPAIPPASPPSGASRSTPQAGSMFRCDHQGTVTYQSTPCPSGARQTPVARGTLSIVSPPPVPKFTAPTDEPQGGTVGFIARTPSLGEENAPRCRLLEKEIRRIDASARSGMSAQTQEWLRVRRREVNDEMWRLKCGF